MILAIGPILVLLLARAMKIEALTAGLQKVSEQVALQKNSATIVAEAK